MILEATRCWNGHTLRKAVVYCNVHSVQYTTTETNSCRDVSLNAGYNEQIKESQNVRSLCCLATTSKQHIYIA